MGVIVVAAVVAAVAAAVVVALVRVVECAVLSAQEHRLHWEVKDRALRMDRTDA